MDTHNAPPRDVIEAAEWIAEHRLDSPGLRGLLPLIEDTPAREFLSRELRRIEQ